MKESTGRSRVALDSDQPSHVRAVRPKLRSAYRCVNHGGGIILHDVLMRRAEREPEWGALFSVSLFLHTRNGRYYALDELHSWLRSAGFSGIQGLLRSSPLSFDPDLILITEKS
jgi:hypothetical protein